MANDEPEKRYVDPKDLVAGPIRHQTLPAPLLAKLADIFQTLGPYMDTTLEQFEVGFMRDTHPEREVAIWESMANAWKKYHHVHLDGKVGSLEEEKAILRALLLISMGETDAKRLGVSPETARKLVECY